MTPSRRRALSLLTVALLTTGPVACSDDQGDDRADRATTTTAATDGDTTTAPDASGNAADETTTLDPTAPTGSTGEAAPADAWTAPGEPSPLELGTGVAEPEYPAGKDGTVATLADEALDLLVQQVDEDGGQILVDVVVLYTGDEARTQAMADGRLRPDEELAGDYYVHNPNPKLRGVALSADVVLRGEAGSQGITKVSGVDDVSAALIARLGEAPGIPYRAKVSGGKVTELVVPNVTDPTIPEG